MKLKIDFSELVSLGKRMLPEGVDFFLDKKISDFGPIDIELKFGKEIEIGELDAGTGLISYQGRQVLLYIRDHSRTYDAAISDPIQGRRFHIAWCKTLEDMRSKGRFEKYHATNRLDGFFEIDDGQGRNQDVDLRVCMNCLERLNYRESANRSIKRTVFNSFVLKDFFAHYSTCFRYMPAGLFTEPNSGYSSDWKTISARIRAREKYICNDCGVDMSLHRNLCDTHHKDGVKYNNSDFNLEVVCRDCHRKKPLHGGMHLTAHDMKIIQMSRLQQKLLTAKNWKDIYSLTDTSLHGDLQILETQRYSLPQLCHQVNDERNTVITLDAAWAAEKIAINLVPVKLPGWTIFTVGEAVAFLNGA